eukprot:COSAG06_NODE_4535_length_4168_cov_3.593512_5_plen_181_part_00
MNMCYAMMRLCVQAQVWVRRGLICVIVLRTGVAQAELVDDFAVESHSADVLSVLLALTLHRAMATEDHAYAHNGCSEHIMINDGRDRSRRDRQMDGGDHLNLSAAVASTMHMARTSSSLDRSYLTATVGVGSTASNITGIPFRPAPQTETTTATHSHTYPDTSHTDDVLRHMIRSDEAYA